LSNKQTERNTRTFENKRGVCCSALRAVDGGAPVEQMERGRVMPTQGSGTSSTSKKVSII
jgi:hypothetical protein